MVMWSMKNANRNKFNTIVRQCTIHVVGMIWRYELSFKMQCSTIVLCPVSSDCLRKFFVLTFISLWTWSMAKLHNISSPNVALSHVLCLRRDENDLRQQNTSYGECQQNYEDTPNIGIKVFMRLTRRLLERNMDVFKPIMEFHSTSGYFCSPCS
jgi:hypothetical protein